MPKKTQNAWKATGNDTTGHEIPVVKTLVENMKYS